MSFVAMDIGASGNRYVSDSGQISVLPNNMVINDNMTPSRVIPDGNDIESCLEFTIKKTSGPECNFFPANVMVGIMAERGSSTNQRPSVNQHKYEQRINYISIIMACAVSKLKFNLTDNIDAHVAVPPVEVHTAQEEFSKLVPGSYEVTFTKYMDGTTVKFTIDNIYTYEESYMSALSFFFNVNGTIREDSKKYLTGNVLSLDIGASTSDLTIVKNGTYMNKSGRTYPIGGNVARDELVDLIYSKYSHDLSVEEAERTIAEGRLQQGNLYIDVSDLVAQSKVTLAKKLIENMQAYFRRIDIDIHSLNAIMVSGGGSMQSQYVDDNNEVIKTSEPLSYYVTNELVHISPGTDVIAYGDDARFANVKGLFIRAKLSETKKKAQTKPVEAPKTETPALKVEKKVDPKMETRAAEVASEVTGETA